MLAGRSDPPPAPKVEVPRFDTVDILVAKADIPRGQVVSPADVYWQAWPSTTASGNFIRKTDRPKAVENLNGMIVRTPFVAGEPIREAKLVNSKGSGFMAAILPSGMRAISTQISPETGAGGFILPNDRVDVILNSARQPRCRGRRKQQRDDPAQHPRSRDRSNHRREKRPEGRSRQDCNTRASAWSGGNARAVAATRHAGAVTAQHRRQFCRRFKDNRRI